MHDLSLDLVFGEQSVFEVFNLTVFEGYFLVEVCDLVLKFFDD